MKFECTLEKIKEGVTKVEKVTGKNLSLPILNSVLIVAKEGTVLLRATNLHLGVEVSLPAKVTENGVAAVHGATLSTILSNLSKEKSVTIELKETTIHLVTKHSSMTLKTYPVDDFPTLPRVQEDKAFLLPTKKVVSAIRSVVYAAAISDIKPEIASVYIYQDEEELVFVCTDSFRLAEKRIKVKKIFDWTPVMVPVKNMHEILRIFNDIQDTIKVIIGETQISFSTDYIYCTSRVVDGVFPDYRQIIPKEHTTEVIALKQDVLQALKMMQVFSDKFNQMDVVVQPEDKVFHITSKNFDVGENTTSIDGALKGNAVATSVNYKYMQDCFQSIPQDSIEIIFDGAAKPVVIRGLSDQTFTYLVMPMNR